MFCMLRKITICLELFLKKQEMNTLHWAMHVNRAVKVNDSVYCSRRCALRSINLKVPAAYTGPR